MGPTSRRPPGTKGPEEPLPEDFNVAEHLCTRAAERGWQDRVAFIEADRQASYRQVADESARWAGALRDLGLMREQRVLVALPDSVAFVTTFLGGIWRGAVPVPLNPYLADDAYGFYLRDSRARVAVVAPWLLDVFLEAAGPELEHLVVFGGAAGSETAGSGPIRVHDGAGLVRSSSAVDPATTHRDEPAFWLYTSGSTGAPKAAVHLHHDIPVAARCWGRRTLDLSDDAVHLSASKMFFAYGLGNSLYCPMWSGGRTVLAAERPTPGGMLESIERHRVTHFYAVPSFYSGMLALPDLSERIADGAIGSLRLGVSAGEALPASVCTALMERLGVPVLDGIGSTEMLHVYIANRPDDVRPGASGRPVPGYRVRIVDADGSDVGDDEIGDLWVAGDSCAAYYWNRHTATKASMRGEWFVSGDKYRRDVDGYFWYAGRADDMFKVHGMWVSPPEVESAILEDPAVREAAVVPGTDDDGLTEVVAFVVVDDDTDLEALRSRLVEIVRERLPSYCAPDRVLALPELPKTATGKIRRFRLRRQLDA